MASYFVTSVWKEKIDEEIKSYSTFIGNASAIETRLASLPMSQASFRYLAEGIELQKFQIGLLNEGARTDYRLTRANNPQEDRAIFSQEVFVTDFFTHLPDKVASIRTNPGISNLDPKQLHNATNEVKECITMDVYPEPVVGTQYSDGFAKLYQEQVTKHPGLESYPASLREAASKLLESLAIGHSAGFFIVASKPPDRSQIDERGYENYFARKKWAVDCLATARDWTFGYLFEMSRQLRDAVTKQFIDPLTNTRRWIERAEIFLYVTSALIALYAQMPAQGGGQTSPSRLPDMNDPRHRKSRPIRSRPQF